MKVLISLDLPIDKQIQEAKGDRSFATLGKLSGLEKANINYIFKGRGTTLKTLRKLGAALDVDVDGYVKKALQEEGL